jgi:FlaA1/EpsC-like NDP-sugar epimerase
MWALQIGVFASSAMAAFLLRFDFTLPSPFVHDLIFALSVWIVVKITVFRLMKLDRGLWRYISVSDVHRVALGNLIGSIISCAIILAFGPAGFPRSIYALDLLVCGMVTLSLRLTVRILQELSLKALSSKGEGKNTLIYGAGSAGIRLVKEIQSNPQLLYRVIGFVDDENGKKGLHVASVTVLGGGEKITALVKKHNVKAILIAIPSAKGPELTRILELCHGTGTECKTIPGLGEIMENRALVGQIREVAVRIKW